VKRNVRLWKFQVSCDLTAGHVTEFYRKAARPVSFGRGQLNRQRRSKAQKQTSGIDWSTALTNSMVQGHPPLNQGTRYAVAVAYQPAGAVTGKAIATCAFAKFLFAKFL
jgi:hypothetical protein